MENGEAHFRMAKEELKLKVGAYDMEESSGMDLYIPDVERSSSDSKDESSYQGDINFGNESSESEEQHTKKPYSDGREMNQNSEDEEE